MGAAFVSLAAQVVFIVRIKWVKTGNSYDSFATCSASWLALNLFLTECCYTVSSYRFLSHAPFQITTYRIHRKKKYPEILIVLFLTCSYFAKVPYALREITHSLQALFCERPSYHNPSKFAPCCDSRLCSLHSLCPLVSNWWYCTDY